MALNGKIQLGLGGVTYYNGIYPFINILKASDYRRIFLTGGVELTTAKPVGDANSALSYLDANLDLPVPCNPKITDMVFIFASVLPAVGAPPAATRTGKPYILKWDGTGTCSISGDPKRTSSTGRLQFTWPDENTNKSVFVGKINANNPPRNFRLCENKIDLRTGKNYELLMDEGEIFDPVWLDEVTHGSGVLRYMNMNQVNSDLFTTKFSDLPPESYALWGSSNLVPGIKGGLPLSVIKKLTEKTQSHPWTCISQFMGFKSSSEVIALAKGATTVLRVNANHTFQVDDTLLIWQINIPEMAFKQYVVTAVTARTITINVNSSGFATPFAYAKVSSVLEPARIYTQTALYAAYFRDNIPGHLKTFFEFSNEPWNNVFSISLVCAAIAKQIPALSGTGSEAWRGYGYLAAHHARAIYDTYGAANRSRYRMQIGAWTLSGIGIYNFDEVMFGINHYLSLNSTYTKNMLFDDVAVTGYFSGTLQGWEIQNVTNNGRGQCRVTIGYMPENYTTGRALSVSGVNGVPSANGVWTITAVSPTQFDLQGSAFSGSYTGGGAVGLGQIPGWITTSKQRFLNGLEPTKYSYFTRMVNEDLDDGRHTNHNEYHIDSLTRTWALFKQRADLHGFSLTMYEGGNHSLVSPFRNDPEFMEFYHAAFHGPEDAANYIRMFDDFRAVGGQFPCVFVEAGINGHYGPFGTLRGLLDDNPRWKAITLNNRGLKRRPLTIALRAA